MSRSISKTPKSFKLLLAVMVFQSLSGLVGGAALVYDPSGEILATPVEWLSGSLFDDYLIPGIILFFVLGVFPVVCAYALWNRQPWSLKASLLAGMGLIIWIIVEVMIIGYHASPPLQLIYFIVGIVITILSLNPASKRFLEM
ncbi:MAG: hypothetical protein R3283_04590 [Balneolaceae bacterium]|nr:hypothetical protein [Balneolaceae bacterium]